MRQAGTPRRSTRDDLGSSFTEYAALLLLVAAVSAAVAVATIPDSVRDRIEYALCTVEKSAGLSEGDCTLESDDEDIADSPDSEDFIPSLCEKGVAHEAASFNVKLIGTFESETTFTRAERADGSVWFIAQPANKRAGVEFGYGARINAGDGGTFNRNAHVAGTYDWGQGQIWTFDPDQQDEADAFEQRLRDETSIGSNPVSALWNDWFGGEPDLPDPQMEVESWGLTGEGDAGVDSGLLLGEDPTGKEDKGEIDMGSGASVNAEGAYENVVRVNRSDPDNVITSEANRVEGSIGANGSVSLGVGGSGDLAWSSGIREDRTEDGKLHGVLLNATFDKALAFQYGMPFGFSRGNIIGAGPNAGARTDIANQVQDTYIYVEFDNEEERQTGEEFLDRYDGFNGPPNYFFETMRGDHGFVEEDPGPNGDPWEKLIYDKAQVWQTTHHRDFTDWEIGATGRFKFVSIGGGYSEHEQTRTTVDAWYLGAPGADGTRPTTRYEECLTEN
ncbi:hypothetical protein F4561_004786 [Lipingzhangella halophila]|uniref:Uncharacterized protein n=1 Tax=Lipingzhangella halophila TaxID=1783352 RepID=A0A7W7RL62_9ACTN|nr:hypothetical protein [Lipingzhangella halophila]MBB4933966.1 hypothetical protein [Lipingzhangella halophila]